MDPLTLGGLMLATNPGVQQGVSSILGGLPIIGGFFGGQSDAEKALVRKQEQMAAEVRRRQQQQALQAPQLQGTAQSMLAFNPLNQAMARMYGAESAFTPAQLAKMVQNPNAFPGIDEWQRQQPGGGVGGQEKMNAMLRGDRTPPQPQSLTNYQGNDPKIQAQVEEYLRQKQMYEEAERRRRETIMGGFQEPGPGPAPLGPRLAPAPGRRF